MVNRLRSCDVCGDPKIMQTGEDQKRLTMQDGSHVLVRRHLQLIAVLSFRRPEGPIGLARCPIRSDSSLLAHSPLLAASDQKSLRCSQRISTTIPVSKTRYQRLLSIFRLLWRRSGTGLKPFPDRIQPCGKLQLHAADARKANQLHIRFPALPAAHLAQPDR